MNELVGITIASEFPSAIAVFLQTNGSPATQIQGKTKLQEFWTVPLSVADQSEDVL